MTILGVGNLFRGDDGAGIAAARRLREKLPHVRIVEADGDIASVMDDLAGEDAVIVIDAVSSGAAPGTVHRLDARAQPLLGSESRVRFGVTSTHGLGVAETVEMARALGRLPRRLIVYGIEAASFAPGDTLSPAVAGSLDEVVERVLDEVRDDA